jgi:uncharacterized membrane protein YcaP (DUF421 family)
MKRLVIHLVGLAALLGAGLTAAPAVAQTAVRLLAVARTPTPAVAAELPDSRVLHRLIGSGPRHIAWWQMTLRGALVFGFALLLVRVARRAFERSAPIDIILGVLIGSNLSRAFTANAALIPTLISTAAMVALYWIIIHAAVRSQRFSVMVKGRRHQLVRDGQIDRGTIARHGISEDDLHEAMRLAGVDDLTRVKAAYLERNGAISMLKAGPRQPHEANDRQGRDDQD